MRGPWFLLACVGVLLTAAGVAILLVPARHDSSFLTGGWALVAIGLLPIVFVRRRGRFLAVHVVLIGLTLGAWTWLRHDTRAESPDGPPPAATGAPDDAQTALQRGVALARKALRTMEGVAGYSFTVRRRERAKNFFGDVHLAQSEVRTKIRREPFSVYAYYVQPEAKRGTEAIYVTGRNDGKLIAHSTLPTAKMLGTVRMKPTDWRAMVDQRYPITFAGIHNLALALISLHEEQGEALRNYDVRWIEHREVGGRACHGIEIRSDAQHGELALAVGVWLFDRERHIPVHMERWHHVEADGHPAVQLMEEYIVADVDLDAEFSDIDFDPTNPEYGY